MAKFEFVSTCDSAELALPERKTADSAGYDFMVSEDIVIPSFHKLYNKLSNYETVGALTLSTVADITKITGAKPTLVPTGVKCQLDPGTYLELSVRSSCPLKHWLIMANGVGIIDRDYWNNRSNEGAIFFQIINLAPFDIQLKKGDIIGQGVIKPYYTVENDQATATRNGGFGSTSNG